MGRRRPALTAAFTLGLVVAGCGGSGGTPRPSDASGPFSVALWGDTPYSPAEAAAVPALVDQVNASDVAFTVFVGDLKGGGRCDNQIFTGAADTFNSFTKPMVYVPGDNEWTDCHGASQDPIERLSYLRRTMFPSDRSFGRHPLTVQQQLPHYPENARWVAHTILFTSINVPGSNDNHVADPDAEEQGTQRGPADRRAAEAEYLARDRADRDWLHQSFDLATRTGAPAIVIVMQADPGFDVGPPARAAGHVDGFDPLLATLAAEAEAFAKPVVVVHGDSHRYRFDHPLVDPATGQAVANVTRVETFGSPTVGWVKATLDPTGPNLISVEPHQVSPPPGR